LFKPIDLEEIPQREIKIKPIELVKKQTKRIDPQQESFVIEEKLKEAKEELEVVRQEASEIIEKANASIKQEKDSWDQEKQQWIEQAKQEGYQAGFEQGKTESLNTYQETIEQANRIVDLANADYQITLEKTEEVIIQLAMHTAEKIMDQKLNEKPEQFAHIVKNAFKEIKDQTVISIYLHPANYENVLQQKTELKNILEYDTRLSLYVDEKMKENSCIIEHPFGQIDASVDTQLEKIRGALEEVMEQENDS